MRNPGKKIKTLARVMCWIGIIVSVISGIIVTCIALNNHAGWGAMVGLLVVIAGPLLSWLNTLVLYAFGELVDNSTIIAQQYAGKEKAEIADMRTTWKNL